MNSRIYLNDEWKFTSEYHESLTKTDYDDSNLETVRIPHSCKETPLNYFDESIYQMICGYRKILKAPREWAHKQILLTFEGAAHLSEVFINGHKVAEHGSGYTAFTINIGKYLCFDTDNVIAIKLNTRENNNIPPFGHVIDYMTYGGIYRDVYLEVKPNIYLQDVFARTNTYISAREKINIPWVEADAILKIGVKLNEAAETMTVRHSLNGDILGETTITDYQITVAHKVQGIKVWDVEHPVLYELKTELVVDEKVIDEKVIRLGFRNAQFLKDGFYLNGRKLKIRGLNRHQSYPYVGYAMPASMQKQDADILKHELGLNAVRTSHYPQSHDFLNRCDEIGLLTFTEIPGWQHIGDDKWKEQAIINVEEMITQYRNHTSIILWGVRINESKDDDAFYKRTNEIAHQLDDSRQTGGVRANKKGDLLEDVYTYNDFVHDGKAKGCETKRNVTSDINKPYLVSEYNGHMYPTKNYDCEEHRLAHAIRHATVLNDIIKQPDIAGGFGWCMADYNTHKDFGSGDRICYHGVLDMFRNPKMAAEVYASQSEQKNILKLSSSMDIGEHPGGNRGDTYVFTNAKSVRMYKNNVFIKEFYANNSPFEHLQHGPILIDDFIGTQIKENENVTKNQAKQLQKILNTVAKRGLGNLPLSTKLSAIKLVLFHRIKLERLMELYTTYIGNWGSSVTSYRFDAIKDGKIVKSICKEPVKAVHLHVQCNQKILIEQHSYDVASVRIQARDTYNNLVSYFQEPVTLTTTGPIEVIGPHLISLQGGMTGTYIKTTGEPGIGTLSIEGINVPKVELSFEIIKK